MENMRRSNQFKKDRLDVRIYENRRQAGESMADDVAERIGQLSSQKDHISIIFAAAPSQDDITAALSAYTDIPWKRIIAFHMDEYLGIDPGHAESFRTYLRSHLFDNVKPGQVHFINPDAKNGMAECLRYASLLEQYPPDIIILGIGENGHIAFNDPPVADFNDPYKVKIVELDQACRQQQVNDGCFPSIEAVPTHAITLTIPMMFSGKSLFCIVPGKRKAEAVKNTLQGPIDRSCPASILRRHESARLYLDLDSASLLP